MWDDRYQDACQSYHKQPFCGNSFIKRRELHDLLQMQCFYNSFVFFRDFPSITASYFITNNISVTLAHKLVCK